MRLSGASIAAALLLTGVCAYAQQPLPDRTPPPRWQRFTTARFSVEMPGRPAKETQTLKALNGRPVQYTSYMVDLGPVAYMASTSDYDKETLLSLDSAVKGLLSTWPDPQNLVRRKTVLYGVPAQIVDFTSRGEHVVVRTFALGQRLYQLSFAEVRGDFRPAHADRFMNSFRLR
ncbi:MAG TPA: hypothetical protein VJZ76_22510 [Thermoanaerobaculia bacterium]|nr:hypothetical protein [Thermoanaerobaculia bacterium]